MSTKAPHQYIRVEGQLYRLAGKEVSKDEVKESINQAADKAAIENIAKNLIAHAGDIQEMAAHLVDAIDDKGEAKLAIESIKRHSDVVIKFLEELNPTYNRYVQKHPPGKK
jgi:glycine cleavage system H lipoate-binding protein